LLPAPLLSAKASFRDFGQPAQRPRSSSFSRLAAPTSNPTRLDPTEASWLNLIEAQFGVLKRFTLTNTDDPSHAARRRRIYAYFRKLANLHLPLNRIRSFRPIKLELH